MPIRSAFTLLELVFVIVVLGILAMIAIPKFVATRDDALIAKARSTVAAVRSGIVNERQKRLFRGDNAYINHIDSGVASNTADVLIFDHNGSTANQILMYGVRTKNANGYWLKTGTDEYTFKVTNINVVFDYNSTNGTLSCNRNHTTYGQLCRALTE